MGRRRRTVGYGGPSSMPRISSRQVARLARTLADIVEQDAAHENRRVIADAKRRPRKRKKRMG